ncbi:probetacellulin isoform X3 [Ambystoma mexicanum]|uniref:probetacellulin isoform X3 n=1 Tax=Ambystoma mexicanum TaxID=8296 RepID=UPI0037E8669C
MEPLPCLCPHLPMAATLLLGLTFLRCNGVDWNSTSKHDLKGALCISEKDNCTDGLESAKRRSHFSRCPKEYKHYCVKGKCRYVVEMKKPSCVHYRRKRKEKKKVVQIETLNEDVNTEEAVEHPVISSVAVVDEVCPDISLHNERENLATRGQVQLVE